jgi:multidrug efflux pump subunit AcrA (membrane-fusion protein)
MLNIRSKTTIIFTVALLTLSACASTAGVETQEEAPKKTQEDNQLVYSGKTYRDSIEAFDLTNYELAVDDGQAVSAGDKLATRKDADIVQQEIALNNEQISSLRKSIRRINEQEAEAEEYKETLENEVATLERDKNTVTNQLRATGDPNVRASLESQLQTMTVLLDNKQAALRAQSANGQAAQASELEFQISTLGLTNKKLEQDVTITAAEDSVVKLHKGNKLELLSNESFVKIDISEKELVHFKKDMALTCKVVYLDEVVPCTFADINDNSAIVGSPEAAAQAASSSNPFSVSVKLTKKYYNSVSVDVSFTK